MESVWIALPAGADQMPLIAKKAYTPTYGTQIAIRRIVVMSRVYMARQDERCRSNPDKVEIVLIPHNRLHVMLSNSAAFFAADGRYIRGRIG